MARFVMERSYSKPMEINTDDLITAIKHASNYEADLYMDGSLILSPLGWEHEFQGEVLKKLGVIQYYKNRCLAWKYEDESKNVEKFFADGHEFTWEGELKAQVNVHDYKAYSDSIEFDTFDEIKAYAETFAAKGANEINMVCWLDNECVTLLYKKGEGWLSDRQFYIVGIFDSFVPPWLCIFAESKEQAIKRYIQLNADKLFEDEYSKVKVHGTSLTFIPGSLGEYYIEHLRGDNQ